MQAILSIADTILDLEQKGFRFAPRLYGFDYLIPDGLTDSQWREASAVIQELKRDEMAVSDYLVRRAKRYIKKIREILGGNNPKGAIK
jgi:hypothetical protein